MNRIEIAQNAKKMEYGMGAPAAELTTLSLPAGFIVDLNIFQKPENEHWTCEKLQSILWFD